VIGRLLRAWLLCGVVALGATVPMSIFMASPRGQRAFAEGQQREFERVRHRFTDAQYAQIVRNGEILREKIWFAYGIRNAAVGVIAMAAVAGTVSYLVAPLAAVRPAFTDVLRVVATAWLIFVLEAVFVSIFNAVFLTVALKGDLATLVPVSLPGIVGRIDPFTVWWMIAVSAGLARLYAMRTWAFSVPLLTLYGAYLIVSATGVSLGSGVPKFHRG
jgi:hypothetical protein